MKRLSQKVKNALKEPSKILLCIISSERVSRLFGDKTFLKIKYRLVMKKNST